jgi:hypothetical protein
MNLKTLTDKNLVLSAEAELKSEREKLTSFLFHLKEIERRRLFSDYGYKSLFDMCVKHFKCSEDEAYRRISAMRVLKELPEVEEKINQGEITLTHLSIAQKHFRQEKKIQAKELAVEEKLSLIEQISNTSVREAEKITLSLSSSPESLKPDQVKYVSEDKIEMRFLADTKTEEKIQKLKGYLAHKYPNITMGELFDLLCDLGLKELNPTKSVAPQESRVTKTPKSPTENEKSKAQIRREVFSKAGHQCEICSSTYALEVDHIQPKAFGGSDEPENFRLLCRSCNQRKAVQSFGIKKMDQYLN